MYNFFTIFINTQSIDTFLITLQPPIHMDRPIHVD